MLLCPEHLISKKIGLYVICRFLKNTTILEKIAAWNDAMIWLLVDI